ncbi:MAG: hypothetical protein PHD30_07885 [Paludibacter sp.]|nr:hypothetical protein [Paludibacter sp.]
MLRNLEVTDTKMTDVLQNTETVNWVELGAYAPESGARASLVLLLHILLLNSCPFLRKMIKSSAN